MGSHHRRRFLRSRDLPAPKLPKLFNGALGSLYRHTSLARGALEWGARAGKDRAATPALTSEESCLSAGGWNSSTTPNGSRAIPPGASTARVVTLRNTDPDRKPGINFVSVAAPTNSNACAAVRRGMDV